MVPAWVMIICWIYLELLVITGTDKLWCHQITFSVDGYVYILV